MEWSMMGVQAQPVALAHCGSASAVVDRHGRKLNAGINTPSRRLVS